MVYSQLVDELHPAALGALYGCLSLVRGSLLLPQLYTGHTRRRHHKEEGLRWGLGQLLNLEGGPQGLDRLLNSDGCPQGLDRLLNPDECPQPGTGSAPKS